MTTESAVEFATESRIHMGLGVQDLQQSVEFYRVLLGEDPTKERPGYAKFEVAEPPVNLALNEFAGQTGPSNSVAHFGIQVKSKVAVRAAAQRMVAAGLDPRFEESVACCYAVQDKVWAQDPDGNKWEIYVVLDNQAEHHEMQPACCSTEAGTEEGCGCG